MQDKWIREVPLVELIYHLNQATKVGNQELINKLAYEIAYRIYIPSETRETTFEDLIFKFGYKIINNQEVKRRRLTK